MGQSMLGRWDGERTINAGPMGWGKDNQCWADGMGKGQSMLGRWDGEGTVNAAEMGWG